MEDFFSQIKKMVEESGFSWEEALHIMRIAFNAPIRVKIGDKEYLALCPLKPKEKDIPRGEVADRLMSEGWSLVEPKEGEAITRLSEVPSIMKDMELFFPAWLQPGFDRPFSATWMGKNWDVTPWGRSFNLDPKARVLVLAIAG